MKVACAMLVLCLAAVPARAQVLPVCRTDPPAGTVTACVYDGDTGWELGTKWQIMDIDAPEIDARDARCRQEQVMGIRALDRLRALMARGYTIVYTGKSDGFGRRLVRIRLPDGRDVASELMSQGLVQALPHSSADKWCRR